MEICSDGHAEICHDERLCPICAEIEDLRANHASVIEELETKAQDIADERDSLAEELKDCQQGN